MHSWWPLASTLFNELLFTASSTEKLGRVLNKTESSQREEPKRRVRDWEKWLVSTVEIHVQFDCHHDWHSKIMLQIHSSCSLFSFIIPNTYLYAHLACLRWHAWWWVFAVFWVQLVSNSSIQTTVFQYCLYARSLSIIDSYPNLFTNTCNNFLYLQ